MRFVQIYNFQKRWKKETMYFTENNNMSIQIGWEILNQIAKQLLKRLNKCILFVFS